jgi:DNA-binding HxlR family transcriptional regulator
MTVHPVKRRRSCGGLAGTKALSLLAIPINASVMQALAVEPRSLRDLRKAVGSPPQTTMRGYLRALSGTGIVERRRLNEFPGNVEYRLAGPGKELLCVVKSVSAWLATAPGEPLHLGEPGSKSAVKALVEGWSTGIVAELTIEPRTLTELASIIPAVSYPSLERRLGAMYLEGLIEPLPTQGRGTPYAISDWLRRAVAPLVSAARWEHAVLQGQAPNIASGDVETAFRLALPLLRMPLQQRGSCRLGVQVDSAKGRRSVEVIATVAGGDVRVGDLRRPTSADSWLFGDVAGWLSAVIEGGISSLTAGKNAALARSIAEGLHSFGMVNSH